MRRQPKCWCEGCSRIGWALARIEDLHDWWVTRR